MTCKVKECSVRLPVTMPSLRRRGCCHCLVPLLLLPVVHLHSLTKLSVPLLIQNVLSFSTTVIAIAFVGHLNRPDLLSSAVLANSLFNVTGYSLMQGLASGMESLCGQVWGGGVEGRVALP